LGTDAEQVADTRLTMEGLGPVVLGKDGSMSLVSNWAELTGTERAAAWKGIAARNAKRKAALLEAKVAEQAGAKTAAGSMRNSLRRLFQRLAQLWRRARDTFSRPKGLSNE